MNSLEVPSRILLVGGAPVVAHDLLCAITREVAAPGSLSGYPWRLDTKYYTADVHFDVRQVTQCDQLQLGDGSYEAIVLAFDAAQRDSFDSLQRWWEAAGGGAADLGVRLAVGTTAGAEAARPAWLEEAEEWCAEQLIEYVETGQPGEVEEVEEAAAAASGRWESEGPSGVQRVVEALQTHMWPGMQLKPQPQRGAAAKAAEAGAFQIGDPGREDGEVEGAVPAAANGVRRANGAPAGSGSGATEGGEEFSFAEYLRAPEDSAAAGSGERAAGAGVGVDGGEVEEEEVEQLERLFAQVASHRAQLAHLPDAQRREAAAAMVMQLMAAMGLDEEDGEWDEEE